MAPGGTSLGGGHADGLAEWEGVWMGRRVENRADGSRAGRWVSERDYERVGRLVACRQVEDGPEERVDAGSWAGDSGQIGNALGRRVWE